MTGAIMSVASDYVTVQTNWGSQSGASPKSGNVGTLNTPGVPETITMTYSLAGAGPVKYKQNAGAFTSFSSGQTLSVNHADTLQFQLTGVSSDSVIITVTGPDGAQVGTNNLSIP